MSPVADGQHRVDARAAGVADHGQHVAADPITRPGRRPSGRRSRRRGCPRSPTPPATKAGAASSADESTVQSPSSSVQTAAQVGVRHLDDLAQAGCSSAIDQRDPDGEHVVVAEDDGRLGPLEPRAAQRGLAHRRRRDHLARRAPGSRRRSPDRRAVGEDDELLTGSSQLLDQPHRVVSAPMTSTTAAAPRSCAGHQSGHALTS